jgi:hypothetical protein
MRINNGYAAVLLGLLVGATGGSALAQSTNLAVTADALARWDTASYIVKAGTAGDVDYAGQETAIAIRHDGPEVYQHSWGLFEFDPSSIPDGVIITNATVHFVVLLNNWPASANFSQMALFNNLGDWSEAGGMDAPLRERVAIETEDMFYDWWDAPSYPFTGANTITNGSAGWFHISGQGVLDLVQGWYDGSITNFGLSFEATGTNYTDTTRYFMLNTKETGWGDPFISVEYMPAPAEAEQTMALDASDDATVAFYNPADEQNFGTNTVMEVRNDVVVVASLATFDLSSLASLPIEVTGAKIRFYADLPDSVWDNGLENFPPVAIYKNTSAWDEGTVTGLTAPTFDSTAIETVGQFVAAGGTNTVPFTGANTIDKTAGGWLEFGGSNTLALVKGWVNGSIPNNGVAISATVANDTDRLFWLQTKEALAAGAHPQLILEFLGGLTYADWAADWGVDLSNKEADFEGDGLVNLLEYAFGGNPTNDDAAAVSPTISAGTDVVHIYNSRAVSELTYQLYVDQDSNLITHDWTNAAAMGAVVTVGPAADPKFNTVTNTFAGAGSLGQAFLKLEVSD